MVVAVARVVVAAAGLAVVGGGVASTASAQVASKRVIVPAPSMPLPAQTANAVAANQSSRLLWVRNDLTGQVIRPGQTFADRSDETEPREVFNTFDHVGGRSPINLSWNFPGAYTDENFTPPEGEVLRLALLNISSDPFDLEANDNLIDGEKLSIMIEPWVAASWPDADPNAAQPLATYQSVLMSISTEFEVRVFRSYMFSLMDVTKPLQTNPLLPDFNAYQLDAALSFAFISFPGFDVASPFEFDLAGFDPPITTKSRGVVMTHWMVLSERPPCPGDLDFNGFVDDTDFQLFLVQYNILDCTAPEMPGGCDADLNFDGVVDDADFAPFFLQAYDKLLCPESSVIRRVYVPLAGGRNKWDNDENNPFLVDPITTLLPSAVPVGANGWDASLMPNALVTLAPTPLGTTAGSLPSYAALRTSRTGLKKVASLNDTLPFDELEVEYERFLNEVLATPDAALELQYYTPIGDPSSDSMWLSNSSPRKIRVLFPVAP